MLELFVATALLVLVLAVTCRDPMRLVATCAYVLRVILCYLHAYVIALPDSQFDAVAFERIAWLWARDGSCLDDITTGSRMYSWIGSCIYTVVGRAPLVLQLINAFLGTMIVVVGMRMTRLVAKQLSRISWVGWVLALHPSLLLYSAITMREVLVVLALMLALLRLLEWSISGKYRHAVSSLVWMLVSQLFHTGMVVGTAMIALIIAYSVVTRHLGGLLRIRVSLRDLKVIALSFTLAALLFSLASVMLNFGYGLDKLQGLGSEHLVDTLADWQERSARGRASYLEGDAPRRLLGMIAQSPLRLMFFLASPFPWDISRAADVWGFVDGVVVVGVFILVGRDLLPTSRKHTVYLTVALVVFALVFGFAMVTSNYGTAFRHRAKFLPALVVLYSMGRANFSDGGGRDSRVSRKSPISRPLWGDGNDTGLSQ